MVQNILSWDIIPNCVISNHFWWFEISKHNVFMFIGFFMCFSCVFVVLCDSWFLLFLCFGLGFLFVISESYFGLDVVYHLGYLYVMCCMCDDNNSYRHRHRTQQVLLGAQWSTSPLVYVKDFQFVNKHHGIKNVVVHPYEELATKT